MVSNKSIATGLVALAASAMALPAAEVAVSPNPDIEARQSGTARVYFCEHTYWNGFCEELTGPWLACNNVPAHWNDRASSVRAITYNNNNLCFWYEHANCQGEWYNNQVDANLADGSGFFNDRISSWKCGGGA